MKVELLIYIYIAVCVSLIAFNVVYGFRLRRTASRLEANTKQYDYEIRLQLMRLKSGQAIEERHKDLLYKKLKKTAELTAFDKGFEIIYNEKKSLATDYLCGIYPVFIYLATEYRKKDKIQAAYLPYIISKYDILNRKELGLITALMFELLRSDSVYCRENALKAIYSTGKPKDVVNALMVLDSGGQFHHPKLISEGLFAFKGDRTELGKELWAVFEEFSVNMQVNVLNFMRFAGVRNDEKLLDILSDEKRHAELRYSAIRYFEKYYNEAALPMLHRFAENKENYPWEYQAISSSALKSYPCERTKEILTANLSSSQWYVRFNSAESCEKLGLTYVDLIKVFDGNDRYAREIMRYTLDHKELEAKR